MKQLILLFIIAIFATAGHAQTAASPSKDPFSSKESVDASIRQAPCEGDKRRDGVVSLLTSLGVPHADIAIEKLDNEKIQNVVVRKNGTTNETVVVGAHYDKVSSGCGVTDNWAGIVILAHLYKTLTKFDTKKSYIFVAFDKEEEGLRGSKAMVKAMTDAQLKSTCAMINLDSFGQGGPMALANASSSRMLKLAETLGKESNFKFNSVTIEGASSDSASFIDKKVPAITLSGLNNEWTKIMHSSNDTVEKVKIDSIYFNYRFAGVFISKVDAAGCSDFR